MFLVLATQAWGSQAGLNPHPLHQKVKSYPLDKPRKSHYFPKIFIITSDFQTAGLINFSSGSQVGLFRFWVSGVVQAHISFKSLSSSSVSQGRATDCHFSNLCPAECSLIFSLQTNTIKGQNKSVLYTPQDSHRGFPGNAVRKTTWQHTEAQRQGSIPKIWKTPWRKQWHSSLPAGKSHGQRKTPRLQPRSRRVGAWLADARSATHTHTHTAHMPRTQDDHAGENFKNTSTQPHKNHNFIVTSKQGILQKLPENNKWSSQKLQRRLKRKDTTAVQLKGLQSG